MFDRVLGNVLGFHPKVPYNYNYKGREATTMPPIRRLGVAVDSTDALCMTFCER
jgi:hypothetical protein